MKVLLPEGTELQGFERKLQETLEQSNLDGYALMGFAFREARGAGLHEIDALVLLKPAIFICLEAKGYSGEWTGSANERWMCDGTEIKSVNGNPYNQVFKYAHVIKNRLNQEVFQDIEFHVNSFVVAPDDAQIAIQDAVINQFRGGRTICICHCSKLEKVLSRIFVSERVKDAVEKVAELGLEQIISQLIGVPVDQLSRLTVHRLPEEDRTPVDNSEQSEPEVPGSPQPTTPNLREEAETPEPQPPEIPSIPIPPSQTPQSGKADSPWYKTFKSITAAGLILTAGLFATAGTAQYFWSSRACEVSTETRINDTCYKDIARMPLRVGILTSSDKYEKFKSYLEEQLSSKALSVVIEGDADISYTEAQNQIAKQQWDVIFALSPMNGMRAKDNGYVWLARMFPQFPPGYQSALYVRTGSPIQSLNDIETTTKVALGDFSSASSFYMPAYDLYGKSMTATAGYRSSKIKELVANSIVDMGVAVYSDVKGDPRFRVIHVSREIPGSGVYISPKISPIDQERIRHILMNAPEAIKKEANYGEGQEPDYEVFRGISLRADEVLGCSNFDRQPVQFFCNNQNSQQSVQPHEGTSGTITGFTNQGNGMIRLRFEEDGGRVCQISIALKTLSSIPNGTSPGMLNHKRVSLTGVNLGASSNQACELPITEPKQLKVL